MNLFIKQKEIHRYREKKNIAKKGKDGEKGYNRNLGVTYTHYIKQINNKDLLYSTGTILNILLMTYNGKNLKNNIYVCIYMVFPGVSDGKESTGNEEAAGHVV